MYGDRAARDLAARSSEPGAGQHTQPRPGPRPGEQGHQGGGRGSGGFDGGAGCLRGLLDPGVTHRPGRWQAGLGGLGRLGVLEPARFLLGRLGQLVRQPVGWGFEQLAVAFDQPPAGLGRDPALGLRGKLRVLTGAEGPATSQRTLRYTAHALGTRVELVLAGSEAMVEASSALNRELDLIDAVASRFREDSEISVLQASVLQASAGEWVPVSSELFEALRVALRGAELTGGAVDPTVGTDLIRLGYDRDFFTLPADGAPVAEAPEVPPRWRSVELDEATSSVRLQPGVVLDLGSTAKALAADRGARAALQSAGGGVLVSLGGDVAVAGAPPAGGWAVGIADVCGPEDSAAEETVSIASGGLATSGVSRRTWRRGGSLLHHIVDPGTGLPADSPWRTVSVVAGTCVDANIASTAAVVKGASAPHWLESLALPARLVSRTGEVVRVAGWPVPAAAGKLSEGRRA